MNQKLPKGTYLCKNTGYYRWLDSDGYYHRWAYKQGAKIRNMPSLRKGEMVHHKNGNKLDNGFENLQVVTFKEHFKIHYGEEIKSEARTEARTELFLQLLPVLDAVDTERDKRDFNAGSVGVVLVGIIMFLVGLKMPGMVSLWQAGILLFVVGVVWWFVYNFVFQKVFSKLFKKKRKQ